MEGILVFLSIYIYMDNWSGILLRQRQHKTCLLGLLLIGPVSRFGLSIRLVGGWVTQSAEDVALQPCDTTLNDGYLGLVIDEGRSKVRQVS